MNNLIGNTASMNSREIAELVEKRHDSVKRTIDRLADKGIIQLPPTVNSENINNLGLPQKSTLYCFTGEQGKRDSIIVVAQLSPEFTARLVDRWQELENKVRTPQSFAEALRLAADLQDRLEETERQRIIAVKTKAEIGSRREATAMNKASQAAKKAKALEVQLDKSTEYCTIKRAEMLFHGQKFNWRLLKSASIEIGVPAIDVFDANYGTVKAYHRDAWQESYAISI
ncbi:Rha family transcriptional regulator [Methylotuvimicrobium sp. KM2]|uniref:Rha family transcriptional regulator n=1 Tax=Methylotuvimicrobium sp. KM2 TaxID=3133976 RepID=UPI003100C54B